MRMLSMFGMLLATSLSLTLFSWFAPALQDLSGPQLHQVRTIYVGNMGDADEADRFRLLLEEQVAKKGFAVVNSPDKADAILTGALSVRVHRNSSTARVYVTLHTPQGQRLWGRDFGSKITNLFTLTEPVKLRAQDVANGLKQDWDKSAKLDLKKDR
ncbi:MAG TPA: hypothetical protein VFR80_00435 [Pyrinomonadaceae bacterium]|nr:hypothetical protein [Pyrinomonadaceae bacterium]